MIKRITPNDGHHWFFGYYDLNAFSPDGKKHLVHRVSFMDRIPTADDICEIGYIDLQSGGFTKLYETHAWNFQQGAQLQYIGNDIIFNDFNEKDGFFTVVNCSKKLPLPVASVSPDGKYGVSVSFSRIFDFRKGYGYCNRPDTFSDIAQPENDGIFLMDMHSGEYRLLASYRRLAEIFNKDEFTNDKIVVNHITFNKTSDRFVFLLRNFAPDGGLWKTAIGTCDLSGNIYPLRNYTYASHYNWKDGKTLLIHADAGEGNTMYELFDLSQDYKAFPKEIFSKDLHCVYSPDGKYIIGDEYPDEHNERRLHFYCPETGESKYLFSVASRADDIWDIRCDLHARWSKTGDAVYFDSTHEGFRGIYKAFSF